MAGDKVRLQFTIDPQQGSLIRQFHREIITGTMDEVYTAFTIIFDREPMPHELIAMRQFAVSNAGDWGSPDLANRGYTQSRTFGVIQGGLSTSK